MTHKTAWLAGAAVTLAATAAFAASPPRATSLSADLSPGVYVHSRGECRDAPAKAFRTFDGDNLSGPAGRSCRSQVVWSRGAEHRLRQHCTAGQGSTPKSSQSLLRVTSHDSFELIDVYSHPAGKTPSVRKTTRFRRCAISDAAALR
ncbi:hypothetical protein P7B02_02795 [Caulobacter segnis]|uniref:hypothetical protein n=1 Tax=Caulobacter segnis TaxID=88688 RepID=UPI00240FA393|nr:hypothetical protein [Caulobacter segnis]MDG2520456.1 hypothetical protein [Caulobacter segnis]